MAEFKKLSKTAITNGEKIMNVKDSSDVMKNFNEALISQIEEVDKTLLPLLKVYINNVRDIRMALGREVLDIIRSSQEIHQITKYNDDLIEFTKTILVLRDVLTPEMMDKIRRLTSGMEE